jgi:hypothetical protein
MKRRVVIDIDRISRYYVITEEGMVYSLFRGRWLKPQINACGYVHYCLSLGMERSTWVFAHTLVAYKYLGVPPTENHEIDHVDENKQNNHYSNLCWRTHSENILESYRRGRRGHWLGRNRPTPVLEARIKMSDAKKKPVLFERCGEKIVFGSIEEARVGLGVDRKVVYLGIKNGKEVFGGRLSFIVDAPPKE